MTMKPDAIEAAARAIHGVSGTDAIADNWSIRSPLNVYDGEKAHTWRLEQADAAIRAADAARSREVKAAVANVGYWARRCGMGRGQEKDDRRDRLKAAYRELFDLLGITD